MIRHMIGMLIIVPVLLNGCGIVRTEKPLPRPENKYRIEEWAQLNMTKHDIARMLGEKDLGKPVFSMNGQKIREVKSRDQSYANSRYYNTLGLLEEYVYENGNHLYFFRFRNGLLINCGKYR